ncbi:MAG: RagB/SusD family nutrient uptake outer membrane protein [Bacteroidetes bacterium]|nr:RagB/SusD family nutrient uptake outer membrane protein [Bacteroidota bacterium]
MKMHKSYRNTWMLIGAAMLLMTSCKKDFLDRKPKGQLTYDTYFQTEDHALWATNAIYQNFRSWEMCAFPYIGITDIISDDADKGSTENDGLPLLQIDNFTFDATNEMFSLSWKGTYHTIFRANQAIENIPNIDMDEALRARLVGEAKFLRAYCYFRLVQWYGDVPIITSLLSDDEYFTQTRRPVAEVYDLIEKDLLDAAAALPLKSGYATADLGRATQGAAKGILAKLYMLKKEYDKAETQCLDIINSGEYSLLPKYADNFAEASENGAESIFEIGAVAVQAAVAGPGATPFNMIQGVRGVPNLGWGFNRPSDDLVSEFEAGDPRRQATIIYVGEVLPDGATIVQDNPEILNERYNQKAWVPAHAGLQDNGPGNIRILRYADILLLAAEALNEDGKAADALVYLNMVRARARGSNNFILPEVTTTDQAELRTAIRHERRVELAMEQQRWFDLLRWGIAGERMRAVGKDFVDGKHELLPLPQAEIDLSANNLKQNPNY